MYLLADLVIILFFLIGAAALGFLLGRRSFRGRVDQLQAQLQDRQQTTTDLKTKLKRCTAKRVALERELTDVRTHLSAQGIDVVAMKSPAVATPTTSPTARTAASASPENETVRAAPGQRFRRPSATQAAPTRPAPVPSRSASAPSSKQDETLQRVRARANKINFDRIGTAEARQRDDLKEIRGIGIFIEKKLNALGIYTFGQIARFNEEDERIVNEAIEFFPGRIARDEWVTQARGLSQ